MTIDETAIRQWADRHECRSNLPILVRRLIRETTSSLVSLRFPGNEAVDLSGLDGQAECEDATTWVPAGRSVWEMGCNQDPRAKADADYIKRTGETPQPDRQSTGYLFVTPRRWNGKEAWLTEKRAEGDWAAVEAYDAIDLETWLEEAPATARWLSEKLGIGTPGLKSPQEWWNSWTTASQPPLSIKLVSTRRHNEQAVLLEKLRGNEHTIPVQADDRGEAVAFVIATLIETNALDLLDRTLVATSPGVRIPTSSNRLVVVADVEEGADLDLGDRTNLTVVRPYPKGRLDVREPLLLSHVPADAFRSGLQEMGLAADDAEGLALKVGHSIPVLRRHLSSDPDVRRPSWARNRVSAKRLLPFALAGSWVERENMEDGTILQLLGEFQDGEIERIRDELLTLDDAPIARYGHVNIVVSQLDALFAAGQYIEREDLDRFFQLVPELLGDRDPALDLPQDQWYMANVLGHARSFSGALLSGLGDALCILSVHGAEICGNRLRMDLSVRAGQVVRSLMQDANEERWLSIRGHLRALAEASPSTFLDCLETELRKPEPAIRAIMGTTDGVMSGECLRTNLLWALELLAWHPAYFSRVAEVVFRLRGFEVEDNWSNSPRNTARSLFLPWLPATTLRVEEKMEILRRLSNDFRRPAMDVCISLLPGGGPGFASRTARPQWRALEAEVPDPTNLDVHEAAIEASRLLIDLAPFDKAEFDDLFEVATRLHPDDLKRMVVEVERWSENASDEDKAELRNSLRRRDVMRAYQESEEDEQLVTALRRLELALEPESAVSRHKWLFENSHVEWRSLVEDEGEGRLSWEERSALVQQTRRTALEEIREELGDEALLSFALCVKQPEIVAQVLLPQEAGVDAAVQWSRDALLAEESEKSDVFLGQVLWSASWIDLHGVIKGLDQQGHLNTANARSRLAKHLPGRPIGWEVAEALGDDVASVFWESTQIRVWDETPVEQVEYAVAKLLAAQRPRSAFSAVQFIGDRLPAALWIDVIQAVSRGEEPDGPFPDAYRLDEVFKYLDAADDVTDEQIANLELPFVPLLCRYGHRNHERTLAVHRQLTKEPSLFVELLRWHYRRRDGTDEPDRQEIPEDRRKFLAELAYHALEGWNIVPGDDASGIVNQDDFNTWADAALADAGEADRKEVAETHLGALLARFARRRPWDDWLPVCILDYLERPENDGLREKFDLGVRNARGVTTRGPYDGGEQERRLAERYRNLAGRFDNSHPRVGQMLVRIAEGYEWDGRRQDEQAAVGERWHP